MSANLEDLLDASGVIAHCRPLINSRGSLENRRRRDATFPQPLKLPNVRRCWWSRAEIDRWLQRHLPQSTD